MANDFSVKEGYQLVSDFNTAYWSGLDCQVYAGNIWVRDAVQVNYQVLETVRPYWHYSHYVPTRLRHGTRMIQGELTINFTRNSYIFALLNKLNTFGPVRPEDKFQPNMNQADGTQAGSPVLYNSYSWGPQTGRQIMTDDMTADQKREFVLARKKAMAQQQLELSAAKPSISQSTGMFEIGPQGFDLNIVFGAYLSKPLSLQFSADNEEYFLDGATFPDLRVNPGPMGTGIRLVGVDIQGMAHSVVDDGRPLMQTFTFLARDVRILMPEDISEFPNHASVYSSAAENFLGPTTTLDQIQDFMRGIPFGTG